MFTRIKRVRAQDKTYEYLQVVESVRTGGKVRQRVVCNLGRIHQLPEGRVDALIHALTRVAQQPWFSLQQLGEGLHLPSARTWGPVLVAERLWKEAELDGSCGGCRPRARSSSTSPRPSSPWYWAASWTPARSGG